MHPIPGWASSHPRWRQQGFGETTNHLPRSTVGNWRRFYLHWSSTKKITPINRSPWRRTASPLWNKCQNREVWCYCVLCCSNKNVKVKTKKYDETVGWFVLAFVYVLSIYTEGWIVLGITLSEKWYMSVGGMIYSFAHFLRTLPLKLLALLASSPVFIPYTYMYAATLLLGHSLAIVSSANKARMDPLLCLYSLP